MAFWQRWQHVLACLCAGAWAVVAPGAGAQPVIGLTQAYEAALQNDPDFRLALAARQEGQEFEALGRARVLPTISALGGYNQNKARVRGADGVVDDRGRYASNNASVQLRQPLFDREAWVERDQGIVRTAASEARYRAREQDLIVRVSDAYTRALLAQDEVQLLRATLQAVSGQMRANEQRLRRGEGTRTEELETRSRLTLLEAQLVEAEDAQRVAQRALQAITGLPAQALQRIRPGGGARAPVEGPLPEWRERALAANGEIEGLRKAVEDARLEVRRVGSGHLPRLSLLASLGTSNSETTATFDQRSQTATVGVLLNLPLYSGGSVSAQERQAVARLAQAEAELDARIARLDVDMQRQYDAQRSGVQRIEALAAAVANGRQLLEATQRSFVGGERTNVDVLNAQENLARAGRDLLDARYQQLMAGLRLRELAGLLNEEDLRVVARQFDVSP